MFYPWLMLLSMIIAFGMAIIIVEKGNSYPVRIPRIYLQLFLSKIHWKLPQMLFCDTCTAFWMALIADLALFFFSGFHYFMWPFSGFACAGFTWAIIQFLNAIDSK